MCGCRRVFRILISLYRFSLSFLLRRPSSTDLIATASPVTYRKRGHGPLCQPSWRMS